MIEYAELDEGYSSSDDIEQLQHVEDTRDAQRLACDTGILLDITKDLNQLVEVQGVVIVQADRVVEESEVVAADVAMVLAKAKKQYFRERLWRMTAIGAMTGLAVGFPAGLALAAVTSSAGAVGSAIGVSLLGGGVGGIAAFGVNKGKVKE